MRKNVYNKKKKQQQKGDRVEIEITKDMINYI